MKTELPACSFPLSLAGPYAEILDIRPEKVTMFDRPSLNVRLSLMLCPSLMLSTERKHP